MILVELVMRFVISRDNTVSVDTLYYLDGEYEIYGMHFIKYTILILFQRFISLSL